MSQSQRSATDNQITSTRLVILDRDGVINQESDDYIKSPDEWLPISGSIDAIVELCKSGFKIAVATNQSGVARNYFTEESLQKIHHKMCSMVEEAGGRIDGIFYCPHHPDDHCRCRKPETGLLEQITTFFETPLNNVPFVGDSCKDILAARNFNCRPILVRTGKGQDTVQRMDNESLKDVVIVNDLAAAVEVITGN